LRIISRKLISMYGASSASTPPNFCTSSVLSSIIASITSSTVTIPSTRPFLSTTGTARRSYLEIRRATSSRSANGDTVSGRRGGQMESTGCCGSPVINRRSEIALTSAFVFGSRT
jgi:hypothetical protein